MIKLYSVATANGQKAAIMLEETELPYRVEHINLKKGEHLAPEYLAVNPVGKTPTIVDLEGPTRVYGTMAIAIYLAEKSGQLLPTANPDRTRVLERCNLISSDLAPAFTGQFIFGMLMEEKFPTVIDYYVQQVHRLLKVIEDYLNDSEFIGGGQYTIADVLMYPIAATSAPRLEGGLQDYPNLSGWAERIGTRRAVRRGMEVAGSTF